MFGNPVPGPVFGVVTATTWVVALALTLPDLAVMIAVPVFVVLAVNVVLTKPGSVVPVGVTDEPGAPETEKVTGSPLTPFPFESTNWKVNVQVPP